VARNVNVEVNLSRGSATSAIFWLSAATGTCSAWLQLGILVDPAAPNKPPAARRRDEKHTAQRTPAPSCTRTGVSQPCKSAFSPLVIAKNSS
jgi:hypothetical protein